MLPVEVCVAHTVLVHVADTWVDGYYAQGTIDDL